MVTEKKCVDENIATFSMCVPHFLPHFVITISGVFVRPSVSLVLWYVVCPLRIPKGLLHPHGEAVLKSTHCFKRRLKSLTSIFCEEISK